MTFLPECLDKNTVHTGTHHRPSILTYGQGDNFKKKKPPPTPQKEKVGDKESGGGPAANRDWRGGTFPSFFGNARKNKLEGGGGGRPWLAAGLGGEGGRVKATFLLPFFRPTSLVVSLPRATVERTDGRQVPKTGTSFSLPQTRGDTFWTGRINPSLRPSTVSEKKPR